MEILWDIVYFLYMIVVNLLAVVGGTVVYLVWEVGQREEYKNDSSRTTKIFGIIWGCNSRAALNIYNI